MKRYYIDTSIWMDYYENRVDNLRPLGEWAFELLKQIKTKGEIVLYSDILIEELSKYYTSEKIKEIFGIISEVGLLQKVAINEKQLKEALILSKRVKIPVADATHAILAKDNNAILITRDKHFNFLWQYVKKPEDLI